jgi:tyrosinase
MSSVQVPLEKEATPRRRPDIRDLQNDYDRGKKEPLEKLVKAFKGICDLRPDNENSFFKIAGYHGMPFRGAGWGNAQWWGGYCNHGNVLFPVWHRAYCLRLEKALQSIEGCSDVMLPFWNEVDGKTSVEGIPRIFLQERFSIGKLSFNNPLYSYYFQNAVWDNLAPIPDADYSKPARYETVRYPFSGLVGPDDAEATKVHNKKLKDRGEEYTNKKLNENVKNWLDFSIVTDQGKRVYTGTREKYYKCLDAPNYTVFSNTTSATQYNEDNFNVKKWAEKGSPTPAPKAVVSLESPHNDIHLAVGGFDVPGFDVDNIGGANGDMGENDTAAFDPIFFFHHCFVDYMFWNWQVKHDKTRVLDVIPEYPGTNSVDSQGPTPGVPGNVWLDMKTPLDPFKKPDGQPMTGAVSRRSPFYFRC